MSKRISFYSFKGGAGRSTGLCNVAYALADAGNNVGIIDFDIEAAGLNYVLDVPDGVLDDRKKLQHYLIDDERAKILDFDELIVDFDDLLIQTKPWEEEPEGSIYFLPAGQDAELTGDVKQVQDLMEVIDNLYDEFEREYDLDYLLLDSRSGVSNLATPTLVHADDIAVFFRWSNQHREGTIEMVRWLNGYLSVFGAVEIFAVPSGVPLGVEITRPDTGETERVTRDRIREWVASNIDDEIRGHRVVPESDLLKVYEQVITSPAHPETNSAASEGYKSLAQDLAE